MASTSRTALAASASPAAPRGRETSFPARYGVAAATGCIFLRGAAVLAALSLAACVRDFGNPSDPGADRYSRRSQAFVERLGNPVPVEGDIVRFVGGVTSPEVEADGLVTAFGWDLDGDGKVDTVLEGTDTLALRAGEPGMRTVRVILSDAAGFRSEAADTFLVIPGLPRIIAAGGGGRIYASDCPVYAQEPVLMRLALAMSHFATERSREEGFGTSDFALKLAQAVTGSVFPIGILEGFDYSFSRGIYRFRNAAFNLDVAFHYGPGMAGHAEGDTVRENLFDLGSYVRDVRVTGFPPELRYTRGPLAGLLEGGISVDLDDPTDPEFDFRVDFNRLRVSFRRATRTYLALSNQEFTMAGALLLTFFEGHARIAPLYPPDIPRLYGRDSLELDFSGTRVASRELSVPWSYDLDGRSDTGMYRISLEQETVSQAFRFGDAGGVRKVFGDYAAVNRLRAGGEGGLRESIHFRGAYSSVAADSARFYCREPMEDAGLFGEAAFETETEGRGAFISRRFDYDFTFPYATVEPWAGPGDGDLPEFEDDVPLFRRR